MRMFAISINLIFIISIALIQLRHIKRKTWFKYKKENTYLLLLAFFSILYLVTLQ